MNDSAAVTAERPPTLTQVNETTYAEVRDFLFNEAAILDGRRYIEWLALLTPDIRYRVASHSARMVGSPPVEVLILDDRATDVETRVKQISTPHLTYTENPAPLLRRFVSNLRVHATSPNEYGVESYLLMCRNGGALAESYTYSVVRQDTLRRVDGALRLARRNALLDQTLIGTPNLATFF